MSDSKEQLINEIEKEPTENKKAENETSEAQSLESQDVKNGDIEIDNKNEAQTEGKDLSGNKRSKESGEGDKHKKHKRRRRQYDDLPKESKSDDEDEDDDEDDDNLGLDDDLDDDLAEIDASNIITSGRRTRGRVIDFQKAAEKLREEEGGIKEEDEDNEFEDPPATS
ncbi:uncharacterized protein PRCAT00003637001 [Priceomyces carsonii]|uniref:uncharacterized protein n=1 Tax=Priceomyces carsonii TaxID=28549 RepID=UPI002EDB83E1|nr:unnamed protein product [Priceomyces carsonii]